ncbi:hypothetical protein LguiB_003622 [Lonicera macranthoides]
MYLIGISIFSTLLLVILSSLVLFIHKHLKLSLKNLPPGPRPWPIIGNIPHMSKNLHITLSHISHLHGPLISLRLGSQLLVVASSPAAAKEILKTHDAILSARYVPKVTIVHHRPFSLVWAECGENWKSLRTLCRTELFSAKALELQSNLREKKVAEMVEFLGSKEGQVVKIGEIVFAIVFNILSNICFSKDFINLKDDQEVASGLKRTIRKLMELGTTPNISDFFPIFDALDPQGLRKESLQLFTQVFGVWDIIIKDRRESNGFGNSKQHDLLNVMLTSGFSDTQINILALELFTAGTDTTTSTIEWAISELLKNKEVMCKVREEIRREISAGSINETQISQLPYLHACVKETLRLHPPVPFLIPHRALDTCEVMNYTIPKNSQVIVNVWAIGRDPSVWEDPLTFKPERFVDCNLDFRGQDFEFLPFGAGRRMCPGLPLGTKQVHLILASLFHQFEWLLPNNDNPSELDMKEKYGMTLQKEQPLLLIPKLKH